MTDQQHTPLPWHVSNYPRDVRDINGHEVLTCFQESDKGTQWKIGGKIKNTTAQAIANAEFIVKACNSYYDHLAEIDMLKERVETLENALNMAISIIHDEARDSKYSAAKEILKQAIAPQPLSDTVDTTADGSRLEKALKEVENMQ